MYNELIIETNKSCSFFLGVHSVVRRLENSNGGEIMWIISNDLKIGIYSANNTPM
jgi:hypothetical protein